MEQQSIYNAVNFNFSAGGAMEYGFPDGGATNRTALVSQINSYICPSDFQQTPYDISVNQNGYAQSSYGGMAGTFDIFNLYCGCPTSPPYGGSCPAANKTEIYSNGVFLKNYLRRITDVTDGTSNTIYVGETSRFVNDPDQVLYTWSRGFAFLSNFDVANKSTSRGYVLFSSVPAINSNFAPYNINAYPPTDSVTGDFDSWLYVSSPDYRQQGQFGFHSQHPGGANFLFGDGSVKFLKQTIDMGSYNYADHNIGVYRKLSTIAGGEIVSSDAY